MLFNKNTRKKADSLVSEVDDSRVLVYNFRRRTHELFENYRAVGYKKSPEYSLEGLKQENAEVLAKLIAANAVDAGNEDCLVDRILGPVRDGIRYLDDQYQDHKDFYIRQSQRAEVDSSDIARILELYDEEEEAMLQEHEYTTKLWNKYRGREEE